MIRTARRAAIAALTALAAVAAIVAADFAPPASAQSEDESAGRIVARRLDDGRVEFGWQPSGGSRVLPTQRYFPADITHNRWLRSSPVEVDNEAIGRIEARQLDDGRIEFAFTPTDGERILTDARYFPTSARPNRWLRSTEITIGAPVPFIAVSAGHRHTCGLRESGAIECWGDNRSGQTDTRARFSPFITVSAGRTHTCGIRESGEMRCWGANQYGASVHPQGREFTAVSANRFYTCGLLRDSGEIECFGQIPNSPMHIPPAGSFSAVAVGGDAYACGIAETLGTVAPDTSPSGEIECWGANYYVNTNTPAGSDFTAVSAGFKHACGLRENGTIECWGDIDQDWGQTNAPAGRFTAVSIGSAHACGLRENGAIECWGANANDYGQTNAPDGSFTAVSAGGLHTCAIRDDGVIVCWGDNREGQATSPTD